MATLSAVLASIRSHESGGRYGLRPEDNVAYPASHASGAYQFQPKTWAEYTLASGIGTQYSEAYKAPPGVQDAVAAYAATHGPGVNSPALWGASAPPGGYPAITVADVTAEGLAAAAGGASSLAGNAVADASAGPAAGGILSDIAPFLPEPLRSILGLAGGAATAGGAIAIEPGAESKGIIERITSTLFGGLENWFVRAGLIFVGLTILAIGLWHLWNPQTSLIEAAKKGALAA